MDKLFANHHGAEVVAGEPLALLYSPTLLQTEREYRQLTGDLKKNTALRLRQMGLTPEQIEALEKKPADIVDAEIVSTKPKRAKKQAVVVEDSNEIVDDIDIDLE